MTLRVSGKNLDIGEALRGHVEGRVANALAKYFDGGHSGHVTIDKEGTGFRTECVIHLDSGINLHANAMAYDPYASFDQAAERIEKRLRRYKSRLKSHHGRHGNGNGEDNHLPVSSYVIAAPGDEDVSDHEAYSPLVIAESEGKLKRMAVSDAVMELDLTGAPVVVFRHAGHGRLNVVYRRSDGNIGWIDPSPDGDA